MANAPKKRRTPRAGAAPLPVMTVRSLEQARVLADPLRLRILAEFVQEARTTKQVAERLGEPAPKLYRHVDALVAAGFLVRGEERQKRGTTERYLRAAATRFEVDRSLFSSADGGADSPPSRDVVRLVRQVFGDTQREFLAQHDELSNEENGPILMKLLVRGSRKGVAELRAKLVAWIEECQATSGDDEATETEYAGMIAFYPTQGARSE